MELDFAFKQIDSESDQYEVALNGQKVQGYAWGPPPFKVVVLTEEWPRDLLLSSPICDLPPEVGMLEVPLLRADWPIVRAVGVAEDHRQLYFAFEFDLAHWKGRWSAVEYARAYHAVISARNTPDIKFEPWDDITFDGFSVLIGDLKADQPLGINIDNIIAQLADIEAESVAHLKEHSGALTLEFAFPPEVRSACEQYLLYFGEFLRDFGVTAISELNETESGVFFSVKPASSGEAMSKIRHALDIYLRLPGTPFTADSANDIQTQKLIANIRHLEGQLALASALMQAQRASIEAQKVTIGLLNGTVTIKSLVKEDQEDLLGGVVSIVPYEGKGFTLHLPEILRRLRKFLQE